MPRQSHELAVMSSSYHVLFSCASRRMHSSCASFEDSGERSARTEIFGVGRVEAGDGGWVHAARPPARSLGRLVARFRSVRADAWLLCRPRPRFRQLRHGCELLAGALGPRGKDARGRRHLRAVRGTRHGTLWREDAGGRRGMAGATPVATG